MPTFRIHVGGRQKQLDVTEIPKCSFITRIEAPYPIQVSLGGFRIWSGTLLKYHSIPLYNFALGFSTQYQGGRQVPVLLTYEENAYAYNSGHEFVIPEISMQISKQRISVSHHFQEDLENLRKLLHEHIRYRGSAQPVLILQFNKVGPRWERQLLMEIEQWLVPS